MIVTDNSLTLDVSKQYNLNIASKTTKLDKSTQLSNGQQDEKIAEVSLSSNMKKQAKDKSYEINDAQERISLYQVADMSLAEMNKKLYRIAQLSAKASSEEATTNDKRVIQEEINQLRLEIQNVGEKATFNSQPVFSNVASALGNGEGLSNQFGRNDSNQGDKVDLELEAILSDIENVDVSTREGATKAVNQTLEIMSKIHDTREKYISKQDEIGDNITNNIGSINIEDLRDRQSVDEIIEELTQTMLEETGDSVNAQKNKVNADVMALLR